MTPTDPDPRTAAVLDVARTVGSTLDLDELLARIMTTVTRMLGADRSTLYLVDAATGGLWSRVVQGDRHLEIHLPRGTGIAGWVADNGQSVILEDAHDDPRFSGSWDEETGYRTRALLAVPFRNAGGGVVGVMQCLNKPGGFSDDDRALLETIGGQCAVAIENARLVRSLEERAVELADAEARLLRANDELQILVDLERAVASAPDDLSVVHQALARLCRLFAAPAAAAFVFDRAGGRVVTLVADRLSVRRVSRSRAETLARLLSEPGPVRSPDALLEEAGGVPAVGAPLLLGTERLGALQLFTVHSGAERVLSLVAARVARALQTRRDQALRERSERLSLVGQMVSGILHDLRNPMSAVVGYAEMMADEERAEERLLFASRVRSALAQMEQMTSEVLEYARGEAPIVVESVALERFVSEVVDQVQPDLTRLGTILIVEGELERVAQFDASRLRRVVANLARNAGEAGATELTWRISALGGRLRMVLTDDGPGIADEVRGQLFEPFATHGKAGGTGLGLAMARRIIEAHRGTLTCPPAAHGAMFVIDLPESPLGGTPLL